VPLLNTIEPLPPDWTENPVPKTRAPTLPDIVLPLLSTTAPLLP
jgi:hypothetical protein